ncbi:putative disease resistance protein RGA1 [Phragmites australis]|uniref:putative disease resistance protein RGA1 n=1 Tax=Phragmites australis TaxID=29695 RepID=UPI002D7A0AC6|nr:putative disease resistance protein RGA1 [Phragmites australis]XP_062225041.1 putative disease resistance protein RGA1 [Phragmites australis]
MEGDDFLKLAREKLVSAVAGDAAATMLSELTSELQKMSRILEGSLEAVDRRLLQTTSQEICDIVDELQANKGPPISETTMINIANRMENMRDMLEKIDWQFYGSLSDNKGGAPRYKSELEHRLKRTGRISVSELPRGLKKIGRISVDLRRIIDLLFLSSASNTRQQEYPVILPIFGPAGSGKTTLAKLVFSHTRFEDYDKRWVDITNNGLSLDQLPRGGNKAALVVLDDLWDGDGSGLLDVKRVLVSALGKNGIVIVTTRSLGVAMKICTMKPYELRAAAGDTDSTLDSVGEFLKESYEQMPSNLRLCFSYCGIVPVGHSIVKDDIIHQWIALDLIEQSDSSFSARQQLGEEYIRMLLDISFLQPAATKSALTSEREYKGATSFTMHDFVHARARSVSGDDVIVLDGRNWKPSEKKNCKYALLTNFGVRPMKLSNILAKNVMALLLLGCSKLVLSDDSFSFAEGLRVLHIRDPSMKKLPGSICRLTQLRYLNLSGCSGLVELPELFGILYRLEYLDLSGCSGLVKLPESFGMLEKLEYLDLSGCSCLQGIQSALGGLTNLQHLNLSHPCCYLFEHRFHLKCLEDVWGKLTNLRYLNLSMCLNPILCYLPENEGIEYIGRISRLSSLEHLDLSQNIFLSDLPESLGNLSHLHTLDLSGCARLKRVHKRISEMNNLKVLVVRNCRFLEKYKLVVRADDVADSSSNLLRLEDVVSCKELGISCLEKVKSVEEAERIRLNEKQKLEKLTLAWTEGSHGLSVDDNVLLEALAPPQNLQRFGLRGYREECLPAWLTSSICSYLPNLVEVTMEDIPRCSALPPLFLLQNLKVVVLRRMASITRIDAGELSGKNKAAVPLLLQFILDDLANLQVFSTIYRSGDKEFLFPTIDELLVIQSCPNVKFGPCPPEAKRLYISACDQLMSSLPKRERGEAQGVEASSSSTSTTSARVTHLVVEKCKVPLSHWSLLHHLPGLRRLEIRDSNDLTGSPEIFQVLSSLQSLRFSRCDGITTLPECLGDLTSLRALEIYQCHVIKSLPESIGKLTNLKLLFISECPELVMHFEVRADDVEDSSSNLVQLEDVFSFKELEISCLEKVKSVEEAKRIMLSEKQTLQKLTLAWTEGSHESSVNGKALLEALAPPQSLQHFVLHGYREECLPAWLTSSLLHRLPGLQSLRFSRCDGITALPEHLGDVTSLRELEINWCHGIKSLPESIGKLTNLKNLRILGCPELKKWCESEENKKMLAHIRPIYEESDTVEPDTTANPTANKQLTLSQSNVSVTH